MIRIILNIKNFSPFLQTLSGEVVVDWVDYRDVSAPVKPVLTCEFDKKPNQLGYSHYDPAIFNSLQPQIDTMIRSYTRGMILAHHDFSWVEETKNKTLESWKEEKVKEYEASDEFQHANYSKP